VLVLLFGGALYWATHHRTSRSAATSLTNASATGKTTPDTQPTPPPSKRIENYIGLKLVPIPAGKFTMGSPKGEEGRSPDEQQHEVEISAFYMGAYEVTQKQFRAVMGFNPSYFSKDGGGKGAVAGQDTEEFPVEFVTWNEARDFCRKLTQLDDKAKPDGWVYRLPTEAEWEYACRGGASTYQTFHFGNSLSSTQANFNGNRPYGGAAKGPYLARPCKVGSYPPNAFGLFDMHGNVWEWCADWYAEDYYPKSRRINPTGPRVGTCRVVRGGSRAYPGVECRSARRLGTNEPSGRFNGTGFRVVLCEPGPADKPVLFDADFKKGANEFGIGEYLGVKAEHVDGQYRLHNQSGLKRWFSQPIHDLKLSDFVCEVDAEFTAGTGNGGLALGLIRSKPPSQPWTSVEFSQSGQVRIRLFDEKWSKPEVVVPWTPTTKPLRPLRQRNLFRLEVRDKLVRVFINGKEIANEWEERLLPSCGLTLYVFAEPPPVAVCFNRIRVWDAAPR
jgi:formylglycine-generating enzyme required for sulfatase activity